MRVMLTKRKRILNLFAGIGGNRGLWGDEYHVTAVELNPAIAATYAKRFPNDTVIVGDAHEYLLRHYKEYDFIWASPPCTTHTMMMRYNCTDERSERLVYPDMTLYQEINYSSVSGWDIRPDEEYFKQLFRTSKKQIIWGGNYFSDMLPPSKSFVVWYKRYGHHNRNSFADCEYAWCSRGMGVARVIHFPYDGMIRIDRYRGEERFHPTQKPVELYSELLRIYATPGDKVLDTHVGSGSSLIACIEHGYDWMGFEISPVFCAGAQARIDKALQQGKLF